MFHSLSISRPSILSVTMKFFVLLLSLSRLCSLESVALNEGDDEERDALLSFRSMLIPASSLSLQWLPTSPHCQWKGVLCSTEGRVVDLSLPFLSLEGTLSPSVSTLKGLRRLNLTNNVFHGNIPLELWSLNHLISFDLSFNRFSGELTEDIAKMTALESLFLSNNLLTGKVPPELGTIRSLVYLDLGSNGFTGDLPPEIGNLTGLVSLDVSNNFFSGELSAWLGKGLSALAFLDLANNSFSGSIPPEIGGLTRLTVLALDSNRFSGCLPREIGNLVNLRLFSATSCSLRGPLPDEIANMVSLQKLDLSNNPLRCSLPNSIGKMKNLTILNLVSSEINGSINAEIGNCLNLKTLLLSFNSLTGNLPGELAQLPMVTFSVERNQLHGPLPSWLGKWMMVDALLLSANKFEGAIPPEIGNCSSLTQLSLSRNALAGPIPPEICNAPMLSELDLEGNCLSGDLGQRLENCRNLTQLVIVNNHFTGSIPDYFGDLPLAVLELDSNNLTGSIPDNLWKSVSLIELSATNNLLEGPLSTSIGNALSLERLALSNNRLKGVLPKEIGKLQSLSVLSLNSNELEGRIPPEIGNCSSLTTLDLGNNFLNGSIPRELSNLAQLQCLVLSHNDLSGSIPGKELKFFQQFDMPDSSFVQHHGVFDLSWNRLSGSIPEELGECNVVVDLLLNNNRLSGEIPSSLSKLTNLTTLDLSMNNLSGSIPTLLGKAVNLQGLYLSNNQLKGGIPANLCNAVNLVKLNLSGNGLSGSIPGELGELKDLTHLDLSNNSLTGNLPSSLSSLGNIVGFYVQHNRLSGLIGDLFSNTMVWKVESVNLSFNFFSGEMPMSLGNLSFLTYLDLRQNRFAGSIPPQIGSLSQLLYLDVSGNDLNGQIPDTLCDLLSLAYLNLSYNRLEGPIPRRGVCLNFTKDSVSGNKDLCGGLLGLSCGRRKVGTARFLYSWGLVGIVIGCILVLMSMAYAIMRSACHSKRDVIAEVEDDSKPHNQIEHHLSFLSSSRSKEPLSINIAMFEQPLLKLTLVGILQATNNFCKSNIIGDGGFGTVYKAVLPDGKIVAVKKLNQAKKQGKREFLAEMETLGKVKHRNLVPLLGYCSFGDEKLLVYEYMVNGSLDLWLRNTTGGALGVLDWSKRLQIATGAAKGLAFLHHGFIPHIIHRDIKASNILLDGEFEAKVADFGLARLISACETHVSTDIAGTFGYIPPEYGQSWRSTTRGDVYSFGVILLELVTGKEPTGPDFKDVDGGNLAGWVFHNIKKGRSGEVLDPAIVSAACKHKMLLMLDIAVSCLAENPAKRPTMLHVVKCLKALKLPPTSS